MGYFAATLTEEVTVKYTAVARRRADGLHGSETSSSAREHTYIPYPWLFSSGSPLNEGTQPAEPPCVCVRERERERGGGTDRQQRQREGDVGGGR